MTRTTGAMVVAALAANASAQVGLNIQFNSVPGDSDPGWADNYNVNPGTVYCRVIMTIPEQSYGIGGARFNIVCNNTNGWDFGGDDQISLTAAKGSATDGRMAGFDFGGQTQQIFESASNLRIDAKGDTGNSTAAGISVAQNTPGALGTNFNTNKSAVVYKFAIIVSGAVGPRFLYFRIADGGANGSPNQITSFSGYATSTSSSASQISGFTGDTGSLFIPTATSLALIGAGVGATCRRRRA